jgi:predicted nucleic acid-binding protein
MLLSDTGPLVAAALSNDPRHDSCVELFLVAREQGNAIVIPATVLAEAGFLIENA